MKKILTALLLLAATSMAQAHFVWVERDGNSPPRAYFGEWGHDVREKSGGALDRIKSPQAWLGSSAQSLKIERRADHLEILVTEAGDVTLAETGLAPREDKKAGGKTRTVFHAKAGRSGTKARLDLELMPTVASANEFTLLFRGTPLAKTEIIVFGPPKWEKSFRSDDQGRVRIDTPWSGRYVLEVAHIEEKAGEIAGEKFDRTRNVFTLSFSASDGIAWNAAR